MPTQFLGTIDRNLGIMTNDRKERDSRQTDGPDVHKRNVEYCDIVRTWKLGLRRVAINFITKFDRSSGNQKTA